MTFLAARTSCYRVIWLWILLGCLALSTIAPGCNAPAPSTGGGARQPVAAEAAGPQGPVVARRPAASTVPTAAERPFKAGPFTRPARATTEPQRVVLVLDATGSMMAAFDTLRDQAHAVVAKLCPPQSFDIIFFNEHNPAPMALELLPATPENKRKAQEFIDVMSPRGGTETLPALKRAFDLKPDVIYFMIDPTDFPDKQAVFDLALERSGSGRARVNVVVFEGALDEESQVFCHALADATGGTYTFAEVRN